MHQQNRIRTTRNQRSTGLRLSAAGILFVMLFSLAANVLPLLDMESMPVPRAEAADGDLVVTVNAGWNLVVDSNVTSPSTYAPRVATVIGKFCNTGAAALTNVYGYIGDYNATTPANSTPGIYPARDSLNDSEFQSGQTWNYLYDTGSYAFRHVGATGDASRYVGTIPAGECRYQYWTLEYPACENVGGVWKEPPCTGDPLWGLSVKPEDDLSLQFDIWGTAAEDSAGDNATWTMTMRNEISAMANKIEPNGNPPGRWFNLEEDEVQVGDIITTNGILYSLGNVGAGFDNDGDYVPDRNAWLQPISQADFDPSCFRLIRTSGILTITTGGGAPTIMPFAESLYFTQLPPDNTGVRGEVYYTFMALNGPCSTALSPYQEVASGYDNEKFNGDYGAGLPVTSLPPAVDIAKSGTPSSVVPGDPSGNVLYTIPFVNNGDRPAGLTLASGQGVNMPLVIRDTVPEGMTYLANSAADGNTNPSGCSSNCYTIRYSTDGGATWSLTDPGDTPSTSIDPVKLEWWLNNPLPVDGSGTVTFRARVPTGYSGTPFIENTACIGLGDAEPFACDTDLTIVEGTGTIGDFVWRDENNDGEQTGETTYGINGVTVSLYWDRNGDGQLDDGDVLVSTHDTYSSGSNGYYQFTDLPAANFLVVVSKTDSDIPTGYRLTTPEFYAVTLAAGGSYQAADFGFGPSLSIEKRMLGNETCGGYEGREVLYSIALTNERPGSGETVPGGCRYPVWASTGTTASPPKSFADYTYAYGEPDDLYASGDFAIGSNRWIKGTGFDPGSSSGAISTVEAVFRIYVNPGLSDDYAVGRLYQGGTELGSRTFSTVELNTFTGQANAGYLTWNLSTITPPGGSWSWDDFALLTLHLEPEKAGGADPSILYVDSMGFHVTTSDPCPIRDGNDIMTMVPLTDTYDTTYLQFVSATPPHTTVDTTNGLITWNNVGPIYPGETKTVYVRFLALNIGSTSVTVNNETGSMGTRFADGGYANDVYDTASGTICPTGSINGYVYSDPDSSGWNYNPGAGDLPIPGVQVTLYGCHNTTSGDLITNPGNNDTCASAGGEWQVRATQVTNAAGYYEFNGLLNGYYYVQVASGDLPGAVVQKAEANDNQEATGTLPDTIASGHTCGQIGGACDSIWGNPTGKLKVQNDPQPFNAIDSLGETINGVNFGYFLPAGAYGSVWEDNNGDGDKDPGEGPIGSVTVRLYTGSCGGTEVDSTTTDPNGRYQFGDLTAGTIYYIAVDTGTLPGGAGAWDQTGESDGSIDNCISFTAVAGTLSGSHDFGFRNIGDYALGDTLYYDWDGDGTQDTNEEGIPGVTVWLYEDSDGDGVIDPGIDALIMTATTTIAGYYQFANLPADSYLIVVNTSDPDFPASVVQTQDPDESGVCLTCDSCGKATLGPSDDTLDFGYQPKGVGAIGDTVWHDMNGDDIQQMNETGIAGITVWLEVDLNNDGTYARVASAVTDAAGKYLFSNLPDATYRVVVDAADDDLPEDNFGHTYVPSTPTTTDPIVLSSGNTYLDADFGFMPLAVIGDRIWRDDNGNGEQDESEPGINGVDVGLYSWNDDGDGVYEAGELGSLIASDTTAGDGLYLFTGLPAGDYVVKVDGSVPSGYTLTGDPDVLEPCSGTGGLCDGASGASLRAGQIDLSRDFGYQPPGVIGDYVWFDSNGDGVQDADEQGIGYVTVQLCSDVHCAAVLATTQTDSDGYYSFGDLAGGTYYVNVGATLPSGAAITYDLDDGTTSPDGITAVTLSPGGSNLTADFGYRYTGDYDILGTVFFDAGGAGDGLNDKYGDTGDVPYENITIYLWKDGILVGTTATAADGSYSFADLPAGDYVVSVDRDSPQLSGMALTASPTTGYDYEEVTLGPSRTQIDFGYYASMDCGDLPETYNAAPTGYSTRLSDAGPCHIAAKSGETQLILGTNWDAETDGQPDATAGYTGGGDDNTEEGTIDDDEDGVTPLNPETWTAGQTVQVAISRIQGTNTYLVGWFDWNNDGDFVDDITGAYDPGEYIYFGYVEPTDTGVNLNVEIPSACAACGNTINARFRLYIGQSPPPVIAPTGIVHNGEVEDHQWPIGPTAVKLVSFTAAAQMDRIVLAWETATEQDNAGFHLYRRQAGTEAYVRLNAYLIPSQAPGQSQGASYTWVDGDVEAGVTYEYMLEDVDLNGTRTPHGPAAATALYVVYYPLIVK